MTGSNVSFASDRNSTTHWALVVALVSGAIAASASSDAARAACDAACQADFVARHNASRKKLNDGLMPGPIGVPQPTSNPALGVMTLNNTAAATAQAWANTCTWGHSTAQSAFRGIDTGENIYGTTGAVTPTNVVNAWENESNWYSYATNSTTMPLDPTKVVGHYTQSMAHMTPLPTDC